MLRVGIGGDIEPRFVLKACLVHYANQPSTVEIKEPSRSVSYE